MWDAAHSPGQRADSTLWFALQIDLFEQAGLASHKPMAQYFLVKEVLKYGIAGQTSAANNVRTDFRRWSISPCVSLILGPVWGKSASILRKVL
jgi:hypothetical protein